MGMIDRALDMGSNLQKDKSRGQMSFFQSGATAETFQQDTIEVPDIPEWPESQLLAYERELLGFYVTSHPLSRYSKLLQSYATASTENLSDFSDQTDVTIGGIIDSAREILTKKGDKMAFVNLQDLSGSCEIIVFPEAYKVSQELIQADNTIFVRGKINLRDDVPKIIAEEIIPLDDVKMKLTRQLLIDLNTTGLEPEMLYEIKEILLKHPGKVPVYLSFRDPRGKEAVVSPGDELKVTVSDALFTELQNLVGENAVKVK